MNSVACEKIDHTKKLKRGDIYLLFHNELINRKTYRTPIHTSIYLDNYYVSEKANNSTSSSPNIISIKKSLTPYSESDIELLRSETNASVSVETFRCNNYQKSLQKNYPSCV